MTANDATASSDTGPPRVHEMGIYKRYFDHESVASVNPTATRESQLANIRSIYPAEREAAGVLAIGIELVDPPRARAAT